MQSSNIGKYLLEKSMEECPSFEDLSGEKKNDYFYTVSDFVDVIGYGFTPTNYYGFLINRRYYDIDLTFFRDTVLQFLHSKVPLDQALIDSVKSSFDDFSKLFPESLRNFRRDLLSLYRQNVDAKQEFVELLQTVPEPNFDPKIFRDAIFPDVQNFDVGLEKFLQMIALPESSRLAMYNFAENLQHILDRSSLASLKPQVHIFGSIVSGLVNFSADIDLFVSFETTREGHFKLDFTTSTFLLKFITELLFGKNFEEEFPDMKLLQLRRAPLIKIAENCWNHNVGIDISVTSKYALHNSRMLKTLALYDPRFQTFILLLKFWAKRVGFVKQEGLSSYCFTLLVLFFFQNAGLLPPVQTLIDIVAEKYGLDPNVENFTVFSFTKECMFELTSEEIDAKFTKKNENLSIEKLTFLFFEFYSSFSFDTLVICPRTGNCEDRKEIIQKRQNDTLCYEHFNPGEWIVEDPLQVQHNVAGPKLKKQKVKDFFRTMCFRLKDRTTLVLEVLLFQEDCKFK